MADPLDDIEDFQHIGPQYRQRGNPHRDEQKLRSKMDAAIRILSNDKLPLQSRVHDALSILSH